MTGMGAGSHGAQVRAVETRAPGVAHEQGLAL